MIHYSIEPKDRIFVEDYGLLSFAKNMGKNLGKNINKKLTGKCSQKFLDHAKNYATDAIKTASEKQFHKQQKQREI